MAVQVHSNAIDITISAFKTDIVRRDISFTALMGFTNQKHAAAFSGTVFDAVGFHFLEGIALIKYVIDNDDVSIFYIVLRICLP